MPARAASPPSHTPSLHTPSSHTPSSHARALSPLDSAWRDFAAFAGRFTPARIVGAADAADALALRDDLVAIWQGVDRLLAAYGDYAASHLPGLDTGLFRDQLRGALDGNATFDLDQAADRLREARTEHRRWG